MNNSPENELQIFDNNLIDFYDLKNKKDTAEIARIVAQRICQDCIDEYHKIKSRLNE